jgi:hypothetical protein
MPVNFSDEEKNLLLALAAVRGRSAQPTFLGEVAAALEASGGAERRSLQGALIEPTANPNAARSKAPSSRLFDVLGFIEKMVGVAGFEPTTPSPPD